MDNLVLVALLHAQFNLLDLFVVLLLVDVMLMKLVMALYQHALLM
jgi:hypothetical protein